MKRWPMALTILPAGLGMGFTLESVGFANFDEVHRMFTVSSWHLYGVFAGAVLLLMPSLWLLRKRFPLPPRRMQRGTIVGAALFGLGWALTGACPSVALVQVGAGTLPALATCTGIVLGALLYPPINRRFFQAPNNSCAD